MTDMAVRLLHVDTEMYKIKRGILPSAHAADSPLPRSFHFASFLKRHAS